ncbi:MAG: M50 family metallopeptidase [Methylococcales bacterium]|nr:M50 family metallopeptidase [Methylococcales bacterium]
MKISARQRLILFIIAAFIIDYIPFINLPFLWSQTFFHEISHGLSAILTGGQIQQINLNFNGSGLCTTLGGIHFIVALSGYAGSALWGMVIYLCASTLSPTSSKIMSAIMVTMLVITVILWARNLSTLIILAALLMVYSFPLYRSLWFSISSLIQLMGIYVLLESIRSPLYLLDGRDLGDGAALAQLSLIPEIIWIGLWIFISTNCLIFLWTSSKNNTVRAAKY